MTPETILAVGQNALTVTIMLAAPLLISALVIGLLIGVLQAATQIQEMTLSFIPKLMVLVLALVVAGPWMLGLITDFTIQLFQSIPELVGGG
ncbi:flagellar biosynthesis protein FliQ [Thiolapillus brandeum]|uniref:Flagellar biosynthetic protein FliQ n=1 Tax=Thiolapillus brandeum TaxID=1076588 RepID=A0A7U6JI16_9GAMM|nr:flagellar biosynthesis protein FliQ [Thiolapillus brandeum]BAO44318.1 flagellar biosynthetic protein FliQ [Thiolapillus brandeum]